MSTGGGRASGFPEALSGLPGGLREKLGVLRRDLPASFPLVVAYSGGVDSSCLLALAGILAGEAGAECLGVIADSPSLPRKALAAALAQAEQIGVRIEVLATAEFEDPRYVANPPDRCYFCKAELFRRMDALAAERGFAAIAYGENADDPPGQRPGSRAAGEFHVLAPLRAAGLRKADVRAVARVLGLASSDAPAAPCLSSRIPHGTPVTLDALACVERGEEAVRTMGFPIVRVRYVPGREPGGAPSALVQVPPGEVARLEAAAGELRGVLRAAGFAEARVDPAGYRGAGLA